MKKLLIWDGDETLWQGTLLEGDKPVCPHKELCEDLHDRGVLQSVASWNSQKDVDDTIKALGLGGMFLFNAGSKHLSKSAMVVAIMNGYGLANPNDVVFLDDSLYNCQEVTENVPGVLAFHPSTISDVVEKHFTKDYYTDEDRLRVRRYVSNIQREQASIPYNGNHMQFLKDSGMLMMIHPAIFADVPRLIDLANRAHRMAALDNYPSITTVYHNCFVVRAGDKYGDYGLCAFAWVTPNDTELQIHGLVISCQLQGRGIGSALLGWLVNSNRGKKILAKWQETEYNKGMRGLYEWYKFQVTELPASIVQAVIPEAHEVILPDWILIT